MEEVGGGCRPRMQHVTEKRKIKMKEGESRAKKQEKTNARERE